MNVAGVMFLVFIAGYLTAVAVYEVYIEREHIHFEGVKRDNGRAISRSNTHRG